MRAFTLFLLFLNGADLYAQPLNFTVTSSTFQFSLTCLNAQINLLASSNYTALVNYSWTGPNLSATGSVITVSNPGNYIITAASGNLSTSQTITIVTNTTAPVCLSSSTFQAINATITAQTFTFTSITPTINITHFTYSPFIASPHVSTGMVALYLPSSVGTYTHCIVNNLNGCTTCQTFIVSYTGPVFPGNGTGIAENITEKFLVYPNPNRGLFKIESRGLSISQVEIYDSLGALVQVSETSDQLMIDIQKHPRGIYILKIIEGNGRTTILKMFRE
jgi:hypothetical protein